jgi:hypothetical protein
MNLKSEEEIVSYLKLKQNLDVCFVDEKNNEARNQNHEERSDILLANDAEIKLKFVKLIQNIMIPNFFALLTTIFSYFLIGVTSAFSSITTYCLYISN